MRKYIGNMIKASLLVATITGCSSSKVLPDVNLKNVVLPVTPTVEKEYAVYQRGKATYYGADFHGRKTTSGERFNMYEMTAAHRTLPFGTLVEAKNTQNGKKVVVRITDRGPFTRGFVIDLSRSAFQKVANVSQGVIPIELRVISWPGGKVMPPVTAAQDKYLLPATSYKSKTEPKVTKPSSNTKTVASTKNTAPKAENKKTVASNTSKTYLKASNKPISTTQTSTSTKSTAKNISSSKSPTTVKNTKPAVNPTIKTVNKQTQSTVNKQTQSTINKKLKALADKP